MLSGAFLAFILAFDEVVISRFRKGCDNTLPLLIWGRLRLDLLPEINAATIITVVTPVEIVTSTILLGCRFWSGGSGK